MNRKNALAALILSVAVGAVCAFCRATRPHEWPLSITEQQAVGFHVSNYGRIRDEIARVSSDETTQRRIVEIVVAHAQVLEAERALQEEASRALGVAVVRSGSAWVKR